MQAGVIHVFLRSEYFKTAEDFRAVVGDTTKVFEVQECPHHVLETVVNFMYGIDLPDTFKTTQDVECLLTMADIYLMEDLKDAVASHMAPLLDKTNILEIYHLAEKYTAQKLKEVCSNVIAKRMDTANVAKQVLGLDAMKKYEYKVFKKDMIIRCARILRTETVDGLWGQVAAGTVGRIVDESHERISVKWNSVKSFPLHFHNNAKSIPYHTISYPLKQGTISHLEVLTPPINTELFKD